MNIDYQFVIDNTDLENEYLLEIGRISSIWNTLELSLSAAISHILGFELPDMRGIAVLHHSSFQQKLDVFGALCKEQPEKLTDPSGYQEVISQIKAVQSMRNKYVHNVIWPSEDGDHAVMGKMSFRGSIKSSHEEIRVEDLKNASVELVKTKMALNNLVYEGGHP